MSKNLIPAPLDEKNVMTDWIMEIFDNYGDCVCNGKQYVGFVSNVPVYARYYGNTIVWMVIYTISPDHTISVLQSRLKEHEDTESSLFSKMTIEENVLYQEFFWLDD